MKIQIALSEETMSRLKECAEPFVDKEPEDVIRRLVDEHRNSKSKSPVSSDRLRPAAPPPYRVPRERGVVVQIGDHRIQAASVRDLYDQVLRILVDKHKSDLTRLLPFKTSSERYLVANKPVHPSGNPFFVPVEYHGHYMEAHKDYKNAVKHLESLAKKLRLGLTYIG
jgi:hypothetical protein